MSYRVHKLVTNKSYQEERGHSNVKNIQMEDSESTSRFCVPGDIQKLKGGGSINTYAPVVSWVTDRSTDVDSGFDIGTTDDANWVDESVHIRSRSEQNRMTRRAYPKSREVKFVSNPSSEGNGTATALVSKIKEIGQANQCICVAQSNQEK
jgi:hypothetical protein